MIDDNDVERLKEVFITKQEFYGTSDGMKSDISDLKTDVAILKTDVAILKTDVAELKTDVSELKAEMVIVKHTLNEHSQNFFEIRENFAEMKEMMHTMLGYFDNDVSQKTRIENEYKMMVVQTDRHDDWIKHIAKETNVTLK